MTSLDPYRDYLTEEDIKNTTWRFGAPPNYDVVNKLFEEGRTNVWPVGSIEERVQRLLKTYEMELVHKSIPTEIRTVDPEKFTISINGRPAQNLEEIATIGGSYNVFLQTSLPKEMQIYDPTKETAESSQKVFTTTLPRGFAIEVLQVYSDKPNIVFKFRHWGYMEGPYYNYQPTGERVEFYGLAIFEMDDVDRIVSAQFFYDRGELLAGLTKGEQIPDAEGSGSKKVSGCPFMS